MRTRVPIISTVLLSILFSATSCAMPEQQSIVSLTRFGNSAAGYLNNSGMRKKQVLVVREEADWQLAWSDLHANRTPVPAAPKVDFAENIAVVFALGEQASGGFSVRFISAVSTDDDLHLTVEIRRPSPNCIVTSAVIAPADVVVLPSTTRTVSVEEVVVESAC